RLREGAVNLIADRDRDEVILFTPKDEHGHFEPAELTVEQLRASEHGLHVAFDDPAVAPDEAEDVTLDEGGNVGRGRGHEQIVEFGQLGRGVGLEEGRIPGEREARAGTVEDGEATDALRLIEGDTHGEPSP